MLEENKTVAKTHRTCYACSYEYPIKMPSCPVCGAYPKKREVNEVDAEVVLVSAKTHRKPARTTKRKLSQEIIATNGDKKELEKIRIKYGYKRGWAEKMISVYSHVWWGR